MKAFIFLSLATTVVAHEIPNLAFPPIALELQIPSLRPFPSVPPLSAMCAGTLTQRHPRPYFTFGRGLPDVRMRESLDPVRIVSEAFRACSSVSVALYSEAGVSAPFLMPDDVAECRVFELVVESLLSGDEDFRIFSLYFRDESLTSATTDLGFSPDLVVTFSTPAAVRVQFDLVRRRASVTALAQWDFYPIDTVAVQALRELINELKTTPNPIKKKEPNQAPEPTSGLRPAATHLERWANKR